MKDRRCGFVINGPDQGDDLPIRICDLRVPQGMDGFEEGQANARLIAAAPDLLAACKRLLMAEEWTTSSERLDSPSKANILRAAIAKAEAR